MKKILVAGLISILSVSLFACGAKKVSVATDSDNSQNTDKLGGWSVAMPKEIELTDGAKEAFEKAMEGYQDADFKPIGYLGSQIVAGTNYKFLCSEDPNEENPLPMISVVTVYADLNGNAEVLDTAKVDAIQYLDQDAEFSDEMLVGGWNTEAAYGSGLEGDCKEAFDDASANYVGVDFEPIALLDMQLVNGINYLILCKGTTVTASPATGLCVIKVYAGTDGTREITSVSAFEY